MPVLVNPGASNLLETGHRNILPTDSMTPTLDRDQFNALAQRTYNRVNQTNTGMGAWEQLGRWAIGTGIDIADTVWSSPLNPADTERGDVWALASPEERSYYEANKGLIEGSSAVVGGIATAVAAEALLIPRLTGMLASSTALTGTTAWRASRAWNATSRRNMLLRQREAAKAGESFKLLGTPEGRSFLTNRSTAGVARMTRSMPIEYAVMWNNESFNSGDLATETYWVSAFGALGGVIGGVGARAAVRQSANSPLIRELRAQPHNMSGVSNDLLNPDAIDRGLTQAARPGVPIKESAYTTEYLLASRSANPSGYEEAALNATKLSKKRNTFDSLAKDSLQVLTNRGVTGVDTFKSAVKDLPEIRNVVDSLAKEDPFIVHGVSEMGILRGSVDEARVSRTAELDSMFKQAELLEKKGNVKQAQHLRRRQRVLKQQTDSLLINGSWMAPDDMFAKEVAGFNFEGAERLLKMSTSVEAVSVRTANKGTLRLDASLSPTHEGGKHVNVESLSTKERLQLDMAADKLLKRLSSKNAQSAFKLTDEAARDWYTLDLAEELLNRGGSLEYATDKLRLLTKEDIGRESLRLKAKSLLREAGPLGRITPDMRFKYNLPAVTPMEQLEDPAGDTFRAWLEGASKEEGTLREMSEALVNSRVVAGIDLLPPSTGANKRVDGRMFEFNRDKDGNWLRPVYAYFDKPSGIQRISEGAHREAFTMQKAEKVSRLVNGDTHVNNLARETTAMPELKQARDVRGLSEDQMTGLGGGIGQAVGEVLPQRFKVRDNATLLAASKLAERAERHGLSTFANLMERAGMRDEVTLLTSSGNAPKRTMIDQYFSLRSGWDIDAPVALGDGMHGFRMLDTPANRSRLGIESTEEWTDQLLRNERTGKPIVVDDDVLRIITKFGGLTSEMVKADNALRVAKGLEPIDPKAWYTPPPDTRGALVGFVMDQADQLVPGRTIVARSSEEFNRLVNQTLKDLGPNSGYTIRTREQMESLKDIWDEVKLDFIDPGYSSATLGLGAQKGGLVGAYVRQGSFMEALDWVKRKSVVQSQDVVKELMEEPLMLARAEADATRVVNPSIKRTIHDVYEKLLTGKSSQYAQSAVGDKMFRSVEASIDSILANSAITMPARHIVDLAQRIGMNPLDIRGKKTFRDIAKTMGDYTPYANATEYLESRGIRRPPSVRGITGQMNTAATAVLLRWLELPHAMLNLMGLVATIPATVSAGRAPISTFMNVKGKSLGLIDSGKLIAESMKDMVSRRSGADWKEMVKNGDATQSAMEYHTNIGAIQSQAGFMKWAKQIDKWASILTDTTEEWSRQYAHFAGLRLADYHGIQGLTARHDFAREIANSSIADYSPINRPELFSSGIGSLFGLFQSYGLNHYTKMFRWMENGQYKQFGLQAGVQATMFGLPGTYGFGHLMDLRDSMTTTGSEPTAVDLIYEHFGPVLGGAIVHGGVSEVSRIALWSRGDMNLRIPGAQGLHRLPALDVGTKVARGFTDAVSGFVNAMPGEGAHAVLEAVQRNMPNRIMRSWLAMANSGREVDVYGQVMTDTQTWLDTVARVVGVRSTRQQAELEAYYTSKSGMERDAATMEKVRFAFRSAVRRANGDMSEVNPIEYFNRYQEAGGNPRMFKTWIRNLMRDSDSPRSTQQLRKSLNTPKSALELWRYGAYGAWDMN